MSPVPTLQVLTCAVHPLFLECQRLSLQQYFGEPYEFVVFNDAVDFPDYTNGFTEGAKQDIIHWCVEHAVICICLPPKENDPQYPWGDACARCAWAMNYLLLYQRQNADREYLILDSDMVLVAPFDLTAWRVCHSAVVLQTRGPVHYFWNGLVYMDMRRVPRVEQLNWQHCEGCDVGGKMQEWLMQELDGAEPPSVHALLMCPQSPLVPKVFWISHLWSGKWRALPAGMQCSPFLADFLMQDGRNLADGAFFAELYAGAFLHLRAGSGWMLRGVKGDLTMQRQLALKLEAVLGATFTP